MLLRGADAEATAATRGNDYIGNDARAQFWRYEQMFRDAASAADLGATVDHRAGPRTGLTLLNMRVIDLTLHAKDLCDGLDIVWQPAADLADYLLDEAASTIDELRSKGLFGPALPPTSQAPADRLLGWAGRVTAVARP